MVETLKVMFIKLYFANKLRTGETKVTQLETGRTRTRTQVSRSQITFSCHHIMFTDTRAKHLRKTFELFPKSAVILLYAETISTCFNFQERKA